MTAQISNIYSFNDIPYILAESTEREIFRPAEYGIKPGFVGSHCWNGFYCVFGHSGSEFLVRDLYVAKAETDEESALIQGVAPISAGNRFEEEGFHLYQGINIPIHFSGGILIGRNQVTAFSEGFPFAFEFSEVFEISISYGRVIQIDNVSSIMKQFRDGRGTDIDFRYGQTQDYKRLCERCFGQLEHRYQRLWPPE